MNNMQEFLEKYYGILSKYFDMRSGELIDSEYLKCDQSEIFGFFKEWLALPITEFKDKVPLRVSDCFTIIKLRGPKNFKHAITNIRANNASTVSYGIIYYYALFCYLYYMCNSSEIQGYINFEIGYSALLLRLNLIATVDQCGYF